MSIKQLIAFCFSVPLLLLSFGCHANGYDPNNSATNKFSKLVIMFYPPQGLGDNSDTDNICAGLQAAAKESDDAFGIISISPSDWDDCGKSAKFWLETFRLLALVDESCPEVLFVFSEGYLPYISGFNASDEKNTLLLLDSRGDDSDSICSASIPLYGACYLAGIAAKELLARQGMDRVLSILANNTDETLKDGLNGFVAGYLPSDWDKTIHNGYDSVDPEKSFSSIALISNDTDRGYNRVSEMYGFAHFIEESNPYDLIFPLCKGSIHGLLKYNRERAGSFYMAGTYTDLSEYSNMVPFSVVKHTDRVVKECVLKWIEDGSLPHTAEFNLENGYSELVISPQYAPLLSDVVANNLQTAITLEKKYENEKKQ